MIDIKALTGRIARGAVTATAEVPHPDERSGVTLGLEGFGDRDGLVGDLVVTLGRHHLHVRLARGITVVDDGVDAVSWRVLAGEQACAGRRAVRGARVALRENRPFARKLIDVRCLDVFVADEARVSPAHVIDEDQDHVRLFGRHEGRAAQSDEEEREASHGSKIRRSSLSLRTHGRSCPAAPLWSRPWGGSSGRIRPWRKQP